MDTFILGPLFARTPGTSLKPKDHQTGGHTHAEDHITAVWGRHRLIEYAPIVDDNGVQLVNKDGPVWYLLRDVTISGKGPDSLVKVPAQNKHNLIALDSDCFHACLFLHKDGEGRTMKEWQGFIGATQ